MGAALVSPCSLLSSQSGLPSFPLPSTHIFIPPVFLFLRMHPLQIDHLTYAEVYASGPGT
jgi:hypothetical protein